MPEVTMTVNGQQVSRAIEGRTLLVQFIRNNLGLTGTHVGCDLPQHRQGCAARCVRCEEIER